LPSHKLLDVSVLWSTYISNISADGVEDCLECNTIVLILKVKLTNILYTYHMQY